MRKLYENLIRYDNLFCSFHWTSDEFDRKIFRAMIWQFGGFVEGSGQPFKIHEMFESGSEAQVRTWIEFATPGIIYRQYPKVFMNKIIEPFPEFPNADVDKYEAFFHWTTCMEHSVADLVVIQTNLDLAKERYQENENG